MRRLFVPASFLGIALVIGLFVLPYGSSASHASTKAALQANPGSASVATHETASSTEGQTLFENTCSSCHGVQAQGSSLAPNLQQLGAEVVDLWVSSGWMPLTNPTSQPIRKPSLFDREQTIAIANYVASLGHGPQIPMVNLKGANLAQGFSVFALNCAPCHTITGAGDALSGGFTAPPLHGLTPTQITEAVQTGPSNMPAFSTGILSKSEITNVVAYVSKDVEHASNPGGLGLGGVGPVAEGFIGLFVGVGACMLIAMWIGDRTVREDTGEHDAGSHDGEDGHD